MDIYRIIPGPLFLIPLIFTVLGFTIFRSYHIRKKRHDEIDYNFVFEESEAGESGDASKGKLFTVQRTMSELNRELEENQETHSRNMEDDIVVEDIELAREKETPPQISPDQVSFGMMIHEINETHIENIWNDQPENEQIQCVPVVGLMIQTLNKYLKNTLMSLLILSSTLPWYSTVIYGFITNSGCEDPTFLWMVEISYYCIIVFDFFFPILIKHKLDRLSK